MLDMPKSKFKLPPINVGGDTFGQRLAKLRKERGITQVQLAAKVGIVQPLITDYERDKLRMHAEMVVRFAKALDVTTDELLCAAPALPAAKKRKTGALSLKIVRRLQKIEKLPSSQQRVVLRSLDMILNGTSHTSTSS